ncbi:serine/threonine-protein kinase [Actinokineospora diospyrosa]|uniref:non-specific serine/threonine protein kinase n=1 Tax=Actinokineospora diospyrosa TaxID=103728 RepID=A0ABT1III7_9PSEU|nr:serine/threonine-protein kinase [Actinokineospora diospyrosa]MCP2272460.1 Serine/threonine protein kinase [Actinokineospora diospyrosa]
MHVTPRPPTIPGLTLAGPLGQGGFGTVFLARQDRLHRDVAVKVDNRVLQTDRDRDRFLREARAAARLSGHPHVVNVYDAGVTADGRPYIVMELCTGGSLADVLAQRGRLPTDEVIEMGARLADALAQAHHVGILHRDIKPANILVNAFGAVKLADFGLAAILDAHAESTVTVGALSPYYAAPEVFAHAAPSAAGDIYSLAATLYTLAAGTRPRDIPWPAQSLDGLIAALRSPVAPIADAPPALNAALLNALAADSSRRTTNAAYLRDELDGLRPIRPLPRVSSNRARAVRIAAAVLAVPVLLAAGYFGRSLTKQDTTQAQSGGPQTTSEAPQAAAVPPGMAACADSAKNGFCVADKCFGGLVNIADVDIKARPTDCAEDHSWQAFAGTWLPKEASDMTGTDIAALPEVKGICTAEVMAARTVAGATTTGWQIEILPSETGSPDRPYLYCLARPEDGEPKGSVFTTG